MVKEENNSKWDSYLYPNSDIFKNNLGITDQKELLIKESELSFDRLVELYENPIEGNFDIFHLCAIHKHLFQDLYSWAGEFRTVNIAKNHSNFMDFSQIKDSLNYELSLMNNDVNKVMNKDMLALFIAEYYVVLLDIHPFRDGNGRSIREFLREFIIAKFPEFDLDWSKVDAKNINTAIPNAKYFMSPIVLEISKALVKREHIDSNSQIK